MKSTHIHHLLLFFFFFTITMLDKQSEYLISLMKFASYSLSTSYWIAMFFSRLNTHYFFLIILASLVIFNSRHINFGSIPSIFSWLHVNTLFHSSRKLINSYLRTGSIVEPICVFFLVFHYPG